ncbi:MAG: hypothetical protein IPO15_04795 [Anaerolineae bacterium]|uniref:hypothetical protein n=1 Tax=Candidatus Amarolinea dominans TaxID=3140696 RepID=UPI003134DCC4|nr:hypothetical protein [Anaerolineae bacterium]
MTTNAANNTVKFTYGNFDDPTNPTSVVDILFTVTIEGDPFADGLYLTNQARSAEGTTQTTVRTTDAIVQFQIFRAGAWDSQGRHCDGQGHRDVQPATVAPTNVSVSAPGSACPRLSGSGLPVTSEPGHNVYQRPQRPGCRRPGDLCHRRGKHRPRSQRRLRCAHQDDLPAGFVAPAGGINLCATDGTGALFSVTDLGGGPEHRHRVD